ncbi:hypothetical protein ACMA1I_22180 [Pontibacter sp. 13R65]|uniref:hypothetical protein n=1 Tax=Pontibacter sp. 13R65 TaxID=3127458 RepID=UPI00301CA779
MRKKATVYLFFASLFLLLTNSQNKELPIPAPHAASLQSDLVKMSDDGQLTYGLYANEGEEKKLNRLPDFSYAGYLKLAFLPRIRVLRL